MSVRRLPDRFGPRGLTALDRVLFARPRPDRVLVQYVPHAFGWKAMNLPFAAWVAARARRVAPVWVMFHEVIFPFGWRPAHALLGGVTRVMARLVAGAAERVFVSIPAWAGWVRRLCPRAPRAEWLPVPSNVPAAADPAAVAAVRAGFPPGASVVGHFGTFGGMNAALVGPPLAELLRHSPDRSALLVGRGSAEYRERFAAEHPDLAGRVAATGPLPPAGVSAHLAACDLLVQPYPDGVSGRRGSAMAGLALGVPTVTNVGFLSEPVWGTESEGVAVVGSAGAAGLVAAAEAVLALPPAERAARGRAAAAWYRGRFAPEHTLARLRAS